MPSEYQLHGRDVYSWLTTDGIKNLRLNRNVPKPTQIPPGHALVRIKAAALNARDMMVLAHDPIYPGPHKQDLVPCADGAGVIEQVGQGSKWKAGDRVIISACSWQSWSFHDSLELPDEEVMAGKGAVNVDGTLREYGVFPDSELICSPADLSFTEMAAIPACAGTAVHALFFGPRPLKPGQVVLTQGTGGVSCFAIQLASTIGAIVIATSSSDSKLEEAKRLGATHLINYTHMPKWEEEVLKLTNGKGVDIVVEVVGAATIQQSLVCTRAGGLVALVGFLAGGKESDIVGQIIFGGKTVYGVKMFTVEMQEHAVRLIEENSIKPVVGREYAWENAPQAFEELGKGRAMGKIVVKVGEE